MAEVVQTHRDGRRLILTINRPDKRNALNALVVASLIEALEGVRHDPEIRVVVLTGAGSVFSAGADLAALQQMQEATYEENLEDSQKLATLFNTIRRYPKVVIGRINGHAIAGGAGLAAVCDISVVVSGAKLGFTEVRIGFVPAIVSVFLRDKLGDGVLRDLLLRGHLISAGEAVEVGLISEVVDQDNLDNRIDELVSEISRETSGEAIAATKKLLADLSSLSLDEAFARAAEANASARGTADCRAGIAAFLNRADPPWKKS